MRLTAQRRLKLRQILDVGDPGPRVTDVLECPGERVLIPVLHARALSAWLGRVHVTQGLGMPTNLVDMRSSLIQQIIRLSSHPAMWGHGEVGWSATVPLSVWEIEGAQYPQRLYSIEPAGREGFLVPLRERYGDDRKSCTAWHFEPMAHGLPRDSAQMFDPRFGQEFKERVRGTGAQDTSATKVRAEVLRSIEATVSEDGEDVP